MKPHSFLAAFAFTATCSFAQNDPYYDWIVSHWGQQIVSNEANRHTVWGEHVDPDKDLIPNLLEYATGTNPKIPNPVTDAYVFHLPTEGIDSARFPEIKAWIRTTDPDLRVIAQTSRDHQIWTPSGTVDFSKPQPANPAVNEIPSDEIKPGFIRFRYIDKDSMQGRERAFMRLKVVRKNEVVTGAAIDPFFFTGGQSFQTGTIARSNAIAIGGFSGPVTVTIPSGVRFFLNDVLQTGPTVSVRPGDVVHLEANTPTTAGLLTQFSLNIGGVTSTWSFRSGALASVPNHGGTDSGYTPVDTGVSDTGAAQISIPIVVSPGTAGMQPNLSINYSSQGGNGQLGVGFTLSGLNTISRVGRTVAQDGVKGAVSFDANDRFVLDGQRLIAINGADGADGTEYRLEFDPTSRIRSYGNEGSGPQRWVVETKAGLKMEFGLNSYSSIKPEGAKSVLVWAVEQITDTAGNAMNFTYHTTGGARGELMITSISYTTRPPATTANQSVVFEYEDRPDTRMTCVGGFTVRMLKRIKAIESRASENGTLKRVRRYEPTYTQTPATDSSKIVAISEFSSTGALVSVSNLSWEGPDDLVSFTPQDTPPRLEGFAFSGHTGKSRIIPADYNGDGKEDLLVLNYGGDHVCFLAASTGFIRIDNLGEFEGMTFREIDKSRFELGDYDSDGLTDMVHFSSDGAQTLIKSLGNGTFSTDVDLPSLRQAFSESYKTRFLSGDYNGDGRTDVAWTYVNDSGVPSNWVALSQEDGSFARINNAAGLISLVYSQDGGKSQLFVSDVNGDGMSDILALDYRGNHKLCISNGNGTFSYRSTVPGLQGVTFREIQKSHLLLGDYNGDGLGDILHGHYDGNFWLALSKGDGTFLLIDNVDGLEGRTFRENDKGQLRVADLNADGLTDFFYAHYDGSYWVGLSKGDGTFHPQDHVPGLDGKTFSEDAGESRILPSDPNGDGLTDFIILRDSGDQFIGYNQTRPLRIVRATNGHGGYSSFIYKPLTDGSVYTKGSGFKHPNYEIQTSMHVVSSITSRNGIDGDAFTKSPVPPNNSIGTNTVNYKYEGAWTSLEGRGFMGFRAVVATDVTSGIVTRTVYESSSPLLAGRVKHQERRLSTAPPGGSSLISESDSVWKIENTPLPGPDHYFISETSSVSKEYEVTRPAASALIKTTTHYGFKYDDYANLQSQRTLVEGAQVFSERVDNTYNDVISSSRWHLGRLTTSKVQKVGPNPAGAGTTSLTRNSSFTYHPTTGLLTQEVIEPGGGALRQQKDYTHDGFGNILTSTLTTQGEPPRTTTTTYTADGRFVMSTTNSVGHTETKIHDPLLGNVLTQTGPNGLTTSWQYDAIGRPIRESRPDGTVTRSFYRLVAGSTVGAPPRAVHYVRAHSTGSAPKTVWYDLLDREIRTDGIGFDGRTVSSHQVYNARGEVTHASQPFFAGEAPLYSTTQYDAVGRPTLTNDPGNRVTRTIYDGLTTTVERNYDPANPGLFQKAVTVVNVMGWTVSSSQFLGSAAKTITKRYDPYGNLRFVVDPAGNSTEIRYDVRGNKVWMSEPNSGVTSYTHNGFGELKTQTNAANQTTSLTYDKLGRVLSRSEPEGVTEYTYDTAPMGKGQLARELMAGFERRHFYDHYGRPASSVEYHGSRGFAVSRGYDPAGRPDAVTYPTGFSTRQVYTANGHLSSVRNGSDAGLVYWEALSVNSRGQVESETLGNGVVTTRGFDPATGLIESIQSGISDNGVGRDLQDLSYSFDLLGNLRERHDTRFSTPFSEIFSYDTLNRLKTVDTTGGAGVNAGYNDIGNLTSRSDVGSFAYSSARPHALTSVGGGNFNKVCEYDAKGNRTRDGGTILAYSSFNKPVTIAKDDDTLRFAYGPDRNLYRQTIVADALAAPTVRDYIGGLYEREVTSTGDVRHVHYIAGGNGVVAIHTDERSNFGQQSQRTRYVHKDHLGSVDVISDSAGQEVERQSYDAWGRRRTVTHSGGNWTVTYPTNPGSNETRRGFTGHEMLDLVGLVHMGGRVYDPISARFLSPDPFVQAPDNLQNLNRYSYVLNNPLSYTDPSGFFFKSIAKLFQKIARPLQIAATVLHFVPGMQGVAIGLQLATSFGSAFSGTLLAGGSVGDALKAGFKAYQITSATMALTQHVGALYEAEKISFAARVAAHGAIQGASSAAQGGQFKHGFMAGAFTATFSPTANYLDANVNQLAGTMASAVVGGTASTLGGGKFANGAVSGAMIHLLNDRGHSHDSEGKDIPESIEVLPDGRVSRTFAYNVPSIEKYVNAQIDSTNVSMVNIEGVSVTLFYNPDSVIHLSNTDYQFYRLQFTLGILANDYSSTIGVARGSLLVEHFSSARLGNFALGFGASDGQISQNFRDERKFFISRTRQLSNGSWIGFRGKPDR